MLLLSLIPFLASTLICASPITVKINKVTVLGGYNATTGVDQFLGVKYGTSARFRRATPQSYSTAATINATVHGPACPQINGTNALSENYGVYGTSEDCTLLEIYRPHSIPSGKLLPVMVYVHSGALTQGAAWYYPGSGIVQESSRIGLPVITVIMNYRLAADGFLGGKEAAENDALNLGLYDQKLALQWVQDHIQNFGGDKSKVTAFGVSSGAMTIGYHMLNVTTQLFQGAILSSGTTTSVPALPAEKYQGNYDALVSLVGCSSKKNTFECLRTVHLQVFINAMNTMFDQPSIYSSRPWGVAIDGDIIPDTPSVLTAQGKIAKIPFIAGNVMDEGTIFVNPRTINTDDDLLTFLEKDYLNRNATFFHNATSIAKLKLLYPNDPALGSPFGTGNTIYWGLQFKRAAAIYGDIHFQWARRNFLSVALSKTRVNSWSYLFDQFTPTSAAWQGVLHTGEIPYIFMKFSPADGKLYTLSKQMLAYWVSFAYNRDPMYKRNPHWDKYSKGSKNLVFITGNLSMQPDTFRAPGIRFIDSISDQFLEPKT